MIGNIRKIIGKILISISTIFLLLVIASPANAKIIFKNEFVISDNGMDTFIIDAGDDVSGDVSLQFGNTLAETLTFDTSNNWFAFSDDVNFSDNKLLSAEIENVSVLPGGAPGLGVAGTGRIVISDTLDSVAPGCTVDPFCPSGTYIWDGGAWISLVGSPSSTNLTKVVTVASSGGDYTSIETAAQYLQTRSGGIMLLSAETHPITTPVDMTNVIIIGKDSSRTTIELSGAGQLDTFDTTLKFLTLKTTTTLTDDMAIDIQAGSSSLVFEYVDFDITTATDVVIDSNEATAPTLIVKFISSNDAGGLGSVLKPQLTANIDGTSVIFIDSRSSDSPLQLEDWNVTLAGGGSVNTSGIITPVPADSIIVSPNMNLQGAIDSLESVGNGGVITLLPGTHTISSTLTIQDNNIQIVGYGDASIISASGITGGDTIAAIQVGTADGTHPVNGSLLSAFKLEVSGSGTTDIHGIRITGGEDNTIDNVTVTKVSGLSGSGAAARIGIQMIDGTTGCTGTCVLTRPVIINSRVFGDSVANSYFTDGIHITSDPDISGVFGNNQGATNILVNGNFVDYVAETAYVFVGVEDASLFNNRATRMAASGGGIGIYIGNANKVNMTANIFSGSLSTSSPAINIESFNTGTLKQTTNSIFNNNIIDGFGNGGVGFDTGFSIGSTTNTGVHNNIFQNNVIAGPSAGTTEAILINGNADNNHFLNNQINGQTNPWTTGINIVATGAERNIIAGNQYNNVTLSISDNGTANKLGVFHNESTIDPTINDDAVNGYSVGTIWINTTSNDSFLLTDATATAANWEQINIGSTGSTGTLDDAYNNDIGERTITVDDGDIAWDLTLANNFVIDLQGTGDFIIQNAGINFATFSDTGNLTVDGQIYTNTTATKYMWLDLTGSVRTSAGTGSVNGGTSPVVRFDGTDISRARWAFPIPDDWEPGTDLEVEVFWSPSDATTGNVYFTLDYQSWNNTETISGSTTLVSTESTPGTSLQLTRFIFTIPASALATDDMVNIRINRNPLNSADTYTADTNIHMIRINYTGKKLQ